MTDVPLILNRRQVRSVDRLAIEKYGVSSLVLMENAGRGAADVLLRTTPRGPVVICCGKGNNGGDGLVIARHLACWGVEVRTFVWGSREALSPDAAANLYIVEKLGLPLQMVAAGDDPTTTLAPALSKGAWIVDALLGTGFQGEVRPPLAEVIATLNASGLPILAVDLPSGLDCDTGLPAQATIRATVTCTLAASKPGLMAPAAAPFVGKLELVGIGVPRLVLEEALQTPLSPDESSK